MMATNTELEVLSVLVGAQVIAAERASWGFENRTDIASLADGRKLVIQRLARRAQASRSLRLAHVLPNRLARIGIRLPRQLAADAAADPPYAVREYLSGTTAATFMGKVAGAVAVASAMGALLPQLQSASVAGLRLPSAWADPSRLERQARAQLRRCREMFDQATFHELAATIDEVGERFAGRPACFAHGDFCPVNALVEVDDQQPTTNDRRPTTADEAIDPQPPTSNAQLLRVVGLLDVDYARVADPLFDAAWWGWVVRYHHQERWIAAWPMLLRAAGITLDQGTLGRVRVLQRLRCLEAADDARRAGVDAAAMWARRLIETLGWTYQL
jgi:aminoglycoside phosphotransferase (APT) family kinase protein